MLEDKVMSDGFRHKSTMFEHMNYKSLTHETEIFIEELTSSKRLSPSDAVRIIHLLREWNYRVSGMLAMLQHTADGRP